MSWGECPACEDCPDREPYTKCRDHCIAHRRWEMQNEETKNKRKLETWLDTAVRKRM